MAFDRRVHHFDAEGRIVRINPYTEVVKQGQPNILMRAGKFYTADGAEVPRSKVPDHVKKIFPRFFEAEIAEEVAEEPAKRRGRPKKIAEEAVDPS